MLGKVEERMFGQQPKTLRFEDCLRSGVTLVDITHIQLPRWLSDCGQPLAKWRMFDPRMREQIAPSATNRIARLVSPTPWVVARARALEAEELLASALERLLRQASDAGMHAVEIVDVALTRNSALVGARLVGIGAHYDVLQAPSVQHTTKASGVEEVAA